MELFKTVYMIGIPVCILIGIIIRLKLRKDGIQYENKPLTRDELLIVRKESKKKIIVYICLMIVIPLVVPIGDLVFSKRIPLVVIIALFFVIVFSIALVYEILRFHLGKKEFQNKNSSTSDE